MAPKRSWINIKSDALKRVILNRTLSGTLPLYVVTEYPKSGGSWLSQLLSEYLEVPFPRGEAPKLESAIIHGHWSYSPLMKNVFCLYRDGRDIMVSYYYHSLFETNKKSTGIVDKTRNAVPFDDYDNIKKNLPAFIKYLFEEENKKIFHFNWVEFVDMWSNRKNAVYLKYEDMLIDAAEALKEPLEKITGKPVNMERLEAVKDKYSFKTQTQRKPGEENKKSFLRKGIAGDWKNHFSEEACQVFDKYAGETLIQLGYEKDHSWVKNFSNTVK